VYLHLIIGILSLCISAHLSVLLPLNLVLNLTFFSSACHVSYASVDLGLLALYKYLIDTDIDIATKSTKLVHIAYS